MAKQSRTFDAAYRDVKAQTLAQANADKTPNDPSYVPFGLTLTQNILNEMSTTTVNSLPRPTVDNIERFGAGLMNDAAYIDEFIKATLKVGITIINVANFQNKLAKYKKGTLPIGGKIEEMFMEAPDAKPYSIRAGAEKLFGIFAPKVKTLFYVVNRRDTYYMTIDWLQLGESFQNWNTLESFLSKTLSAMYTKMEADEYRAMKQVLVDMGRRGFLKEVRIPRPSLTDKSTIEAFAAAIEEYSGMMTYYDYPYNRINFPNPVQRQDQILFLTESVMAKTKIGFYAQIFNKEEAEMEADVTTVDNFAYQLPGTNEIRKYDGCLAILADRDFYVVYDRDMPQFPPVQNAAAGTSNQIIHVQQVMAASQGVNAIAFIDEAFYTTKISSVKILPIVELAFEGEPSQFAINALITDDNLDAIDSQITAIDVDITAGSSDLTIEKGENGLTFTVIPATDYAGFGFERVHVAVKSVTRIDRTGQEQIISNKDADGEIVPVIDEVEVQINEALLNFYRGKDCDPACPGTPGPAGPAGPKGDPGKDGKDADMTDIYTKEEADAKIKAGDDATLAAANTYTDSKIPGQQDEVEQQETPAKKDKK